MASLPYLGTLKTEIDVHTTVKESIGYGKMTPQQQAVVNNRLKKLGAITASTLFWSLPPGVVQKPLVVDFRDPAVPNDRNDCKYAVPIAISLPTEVGECATVFNHAKLTNTGPFVIEKRPNAVVFYCSFGAQRSLEMAYRYLEWLELQNFAQETEVAYLSREMLGYSTFTDMELGRPPKEVALQRATFMKFWP